MTLSADNNAPFVYKSYAFAMTSSRAALKDVSPDAETKSPSPRGAAENSRLRLLVVDDLADAADSLAILLQLLGHTVRIAYDGKAALALAAEFRPHAALLDLGLPELDGYQIASCLRQQARMQRLCLIAVSGLRNAGR